MNMLFQIQLRKQVKILRDMEGDYTSMQCAYTWCGSLGTERVKRNNSKVWSSAEQAPG
jgi:hypothetical protein